MSCKASTSLRLLAVTLLFLLHCLGMKEKILDGDYFDNKSVDEPEAEEVDCVSFGDSFLR